MYRTQSVTRVKTHYCVKIALLSAVAAIIMFLETPIPGMPAFLKMDLSEIPVLVGTFALGPLAGVLIELIKNLVHMPSTGTAFIGEIANFLVGVCFVLPAGFIYRMNKSKNGAIMALVAGTISMTTIAALLNYFIILPLYQKVLNLPMEAIVSMGTEANKAIVDLKTLIIYAFVPFNLLQSIIISVVTLLIYKKISPILHR